MEMNLRDYRKKAAISQEEASKMFNMSRKTYIAYENDESRKESIQYKYMIEQLQKLVLIDETHGILKVEDIKRICNSVFSKYDVKSCYLFGSYAKGKATEKSDVDLAIDTSVTGLYFFGLCEELREALGKVVDLIDLKQLTANSELLSEVLKDGIKIYG